MPDRHYPSDSAARTKPWWSFTILFVIMLACVSCSDVAKPPSPSRRATVQPPHMTEGGSMPLTDSAPPQAETPTVLVSTPQSVLVTTTPKMTKTTVIDNSVKGTSINQFNYVGNGWQDCSNKQNPCEGASALYNGTLSVDRTTNDYVTLTFIGVQIRFHGELDTDHGIGAISLDRGSETMVDFYAATRAGNQLLWTSQVLSAGTHTFKLRVTGNKNPSSADTFINVDHVDIVS